MYIIPKIKQFIEKIKSRCILQLRGHYWILSVSQLSDFVNSRSWNPMQVLYYPALWLKPWRWRQRVSPKRWNRPTKTQGAKTQDNTNVATLVGNVDRRGWFNAHPKNIYLLGINVCYRQQQQWILNDSSGNDNDSDSDLTHTLELAQPLGE
jgi:hypothetical protein